MKVGTIKVAGVLVALVVGGVLLSGHNPSSWFNENSKSDERLVTFIGVWGDGATPTQGGEMLIYTSEFGTEHFEVGPNKHSSAPVTRPIQRTVKRGSHVSLTVQGAGSMYLVGGSISIHPGTIHSDTPSTSRPARVDIPSVP